AHPAQQLVHLRIRVVSAGPLDELGLSASTLRPTHQDAFKIVRVALPEIFRHQMQRQIRGGEHAASSVNRTVVDVEMLSLQSDMGESLPEFSGKLPMRRRATPV